VRIYTSMPLEDRFWKKVMKTETCWLWTACLDLDGYGLISSGGHDGINLKAHRVSYLINIGPIPEGLSILHRCDVRCCVNPHHLFSGTQSENLLDMFAKGRARGKQLGGMPGEENGRAKLTIANIKDIRELLEKKHFLIKEIAASFGVSATQISRICHNKQWRSIA